MILKAIIGVLVLSYAFELIVECLNLSFLRESLPKEAKDFYDKKKYTKSQKYLRETTKFGLFSGAISTAIMIAMLVTGSFGWLDQLVRIVTTNDIGAGVIFFGIGITVSTLFSIPFSVYSTFVIEEKYGFNKTTPQTFITDTIKGLVLTLVIGLPLIAVVLGFFQVLGASGWVYIWIVLTIFQIFMLFIAPVVIMPLFNTFTPLSKGKLRTAIEKYADKQNFKLEGIYTMDGSKRSTKSNAFFTGFGKFKRIALFDTLIKDQTTDELVAVLAHEIGHYKKGHIIQQMVVSIIMTGVTLFIFSRFIGNQAIVQAIGFETVSVYASLIGIALLYSPISQVVSILGNVLSRKNEFEADAYSAQTFGKPEALVSALKKLSSDNLTNLTPHPLKVFVDYSHPPVLERIKTLNKS